MPAPRNAPEVLDQEFLTIRSKFIDLAAALDRIDRAEGSAAGDPRMGQISLGLRLLAGEGPGRVEKVQMLFSLRYEQDWRDK